VANGTKAIDGDERENLVGWGAWPMCSRKAVLR
jgi:hypothetical protein